jgi:argininosuccinate lyase
MGVAAGQFRRRFFDMKMANSQMESTVGAIGARDRMRVDLNATYARCILEPIFEFNCKYNFYPLVEAHRAWLTMLAERKIVPMDQAALILRGLDELDQEGPDSSRPFSAAAEFYYLHVERALVKRVPGGEEVVGNLNLGRTRPEPLARMVMREAILRVLDMALKLRRTLLRRAEAEADTVMPGYTHLLHAQPTTLGHYLLAIQDHLERDTRRLLAAYATTDQCTLGCGAMSGTSLNVDRQRVRELLGFSRLCENTIDSVSASDHVTETASALTGLMSIVGRLCQDLYIWSSQEFAMIDVTDAFASPSSLMPQKKNALVLEYMRSRTARTIGALGGSFAVLHNVGYMDTEEVELETYRPLFEAFAMTEETLPTLEALVAVMEPNRKLMQDRAAWGFSSVTALAEAIQTKKDMSYRTAHRIVARAVLLAVERGRPATGIDAAIVDQAGIEMTGEPVGFDDATISQCLDPVKFVEHHAVTGGTAPSQVRAMAGVRRQRLEADEKSVADRRKAIAAGKDLLRQAMDKVKGN